MDKDTTVLLIDENPAAIDLIRRALGDQANRFRLRRVADVPTALARIWGGGVGLALLNLPPTGSCGDRLAPFLTLQEKAPGIPIVFLCASTDEDLAKAAVRAGAADYLIHETVDLDLLRVLRSASSKTPLAATPSFSPSPGRKGGKIIVFMGSKGGVGTTTAAMNGAAALAQDRKRQHRPVILADLHAELGSLPLYFHPHRSIRDIGDLLQGGVEEIPLGKLESCLWPVKAVPGLQVLFGSRSPEHARLLTPANAARILVRAAEIADYVVVDLPVSLSDTCRAVLENSDCLALVVERDPISVQAAKLILSGIDSWKAGKLTIGAVILNRAGLVSPMSFAEIDAELHIATLGVIPPACDLCAAAQHARTPMVALDTESIASIAMRNLGQEIEDLVPAARNSEHAEEGPLPTYPAARKITRAGLR